VVYNFGCTAALKENGVNAGRCKALLNIKCEVSPTKQAKGDSGESDKEIIIF